MILCPNYCHSCTKGSQFESLRKPAVGPEHSKDPKEGPGVNQDTHLVRELEEPAARDVHVIVRSTAMVISWLAGFWATSTSLWGPHT